MTLCKTKQSTLNAVKWTELHTTKLDSSTKNAWGDIPWQLGKGGRLCPHRPSRPTASGWGDSPGQRAQCCGESYAILSVSGSLGGFAPPLRQPALRNRAKNHKQHRQRKRVPEQPIFEQTKIADEPYRVAVTSQSNLYILFVKHRCCSVNTKTQTQST